MAIERNIEVKGVEYFCPIPVAEEIDRLRTIDDAMVERALVKWWQIDHIAEGGDPEFILLSMRDMRQALEAALKVPDETIWDRAIAMKPPKALDAIADAVLAYRPRPKSEPAKRRKRRKAKLAKKPR